MAREPEKRELTDGFNLQTTNNPGIGGGTCFGDSGGPVFYGGFSSNTIVGVTSFGLSSNVCAGVDFAYRTDQADVIAWILAHAPAGEQSFVLRMTKCFNRPNARVVADS